MGIDIAVLWRSLIPIGIHIMLVSAKQTLMTPLPKKPGDDPNAEAADGLQGGLQAALMQNLQNSLKVQTSKVEGNIHAAAVSKLATEQVSAASKITDNIDEAFAKTRVALQSTDSSSVPRAGEGTGVADFKDYMSKTPEQRLRDSVLDEMGISEEDLKAMPPEKQLAISNEIADRLQDKMKVAQADQTDSSSDKGVARVVDKFLAAL
jgi:hypothetical protein